MILYSIVPAEIVFRDLVQDHDKQSLVVYYLGEKIEVTPSLDNTYLINRLISTSPKAYLNPKLQPGTIIKANLVQNANPTYYPPNIKK